MRIELIYEHPDTVPADLERPVAYLMNAPSATSATASFIRFRELTLYPLIQAEPDHPDWPKFLRCVEAVLEWRETIAPGDRFWRERPKLITSDRAPAGGSAERPPPW